ncbi:MAG: hypothetical protein B7X48_07095, partial [Acidiphilium sp. 34-60-192]
NDGFGFGGIGGEGGEAAGEKDEAVPDGPFEVLLDGAGLFVGAEDLAEHEQNPGETVGEGLCVGVNITRHALILHRSERVRKAKNLFDCWGGLFKHAVGFGGMDLTSGSEKWRM